jgi:glycosyltransferase involved in cell wall biosynthesis
MIGNFAPRQCGIATFTTDLSTAISALGIREAAERSEEFECFVLAMNDPGRRHAYPRQVRFELGEADLPAYRRAADFLNVNAVDVVSLQHEYGIFGGKAGRYILDTLRELRMPVVTTLHTILAAPDAAQKAVMDEIVTLSERLVVMSEDGAALLGRVHGVDRGRIDVIPHGIPALPTTRGQKEALGVTGQPLLLTFGLLSPDKGIEHVIDALPAILRDFPTAVYFIVGATHPHIKERDGESYRIALENRAVRLGVEGHVRFYNRFVSHEELVAFLSAADIYLTPYLKSEQITSGTLAYAVGSGKAVLSTPYRYARELLADGRGILVPVGDAPAIAAGAIALLSDESLRKSVEASALAYGQQMAWPVVAASYLTTFAHAQKAFDSRARAGARAHSLTKRVPDLPELNLQHLRRMTDGTGMLQHAAFQLPRYEDGYCIDDNARALLFTTVVEEAGVDDPKEIRALGSRYLAFVHYAFNRSIGRFRNFMSYSRVWMEECGSEDSHGRTLWALGTLVGSSIDRGQRSLAVDLFLAALPATLSFTSPRSWAYTILGIDRYLRAYKGDSSVQAIGAALAEKLVARFRASATPSWPWFEDRLTYCNPRLPEALLLAGSWRENEEMNDIGLEALEWLTGEQRGADGSFAPIGSDGFYVRGGPKARFDQQSVEACAMVSAALTAEAKTGQRHWRGRARWAFGWFLGNNELQLPVYDAATGGCRDGLHADRVNENQGAEATLSFLMARTDLHLAEHAISIIPRAPASSPLLCEIPADAN